jgi:ParB family transcriptional regulator, chromosome partitioning protein
VVARRSGLGRGLGALIPSEAAASDSGPLRFTEIPVSGIVSSPHQPRRGFDEDTLAALTASVRELGILQPVLVRPLGDDRYELVAGERRWRAAKRAGLPSVPAIVRDVDDATSLEHALVENIHRQDLNALEEAAAYQQLIEDFHLTHDQVASRVGKSRAAVSNTLRLFQLPPAIQKMVAEGELSAGHARALLGTPDRAYQEQLARRAVADGLSVREIEDAVRQRTELAGETPSGASIEGESGGPGADVAASTVRRLRAPGLLELEQLFSHYLDTRVNVTMGPRRGRIAIEFADLEDLERIYRVITGEASDES